MHLLWNPWQGIPKAYCICGAMPPLPQLRTTPGLPQNLLYRLHPHPRHPLKVTSVVGEQGKVVVEGGCTYEQVEVTNKSACGSETAAFSTEDFGDSLVETKYGDTTKKIIEILLVPVRIT